MMIKKEETKIVKMTYQKKQQKHQLELSREYAELTRTKINI